MPHHTDGDVLLHEPLGFPPSQQSDHSTFHIPDSQASSQTKQNNALSALDTSASQNGPVQPTFIGANISPISSDGVGAPQIEEPQLSQHWQDYSSQRSETLGGAWMRPRTPVFVVNGENQQVNSYTNGHGSPLSRGSGSPTHGLKRTANGAIKLRSPLEDGTASMKVTNGHTRHMSLGSENSKVSELSAQLKTRLSYAMVKVQNGWQGRSINEVESLAASALTSPVSATGPAGDVWTFPRPMAAAHATQTSKDLSARLSNQVNMQHGHFSHTPNGPSHRHGLSLDARLQNQQNQRPGPQLAPAPELIPNRHRRTNGQHARPSLVTSSVNSHSPAAAQLYYSRTTPPTDQEQDAIDTLLFMSSPANSSQFPRSSQTSPRKNGFVGLHPNGMLDRRQNSLGSSEDDAADYQRHAKRRSLGFLRSGSDVDRMLKQMGEKEVDAEINAETSKEAGHGASAASRTWIRS